MIILLETVQSKIFLFLIAVVLCAGCVQPIQPFSHVAPGKWRGVLVLDSEKQILPGIESRKNMGQQLYESNELFQLPFNFDVVNEGDEWYVVILNGTERIELKQVSIGKDKTTAHDTIRIDFPVYDSHISAIVREDIMQGYWVVHAKDNYRVPFIGYHGVKQRFWQPILKDKKVNADFSGKWKVEFSDDNSSYPAIAQIKQNGDHVSATFVTETGDYRFLEGIVFEDELWLSVFDGAHAFLFQGKMKLDGSIDGVFRSGKHYESTWTASRDETFQLINPDSLSRATADHIDLKLTNQDGQLKSVIDQNHDGISIIQILGTWCPNCKDESEFLINYLKNNPDKNIKVSAIAFERYRDEAKALRQIKSFRKNMNIPYDVFYGGYASKKEASELLPMIDKVISYPTMVITDKKGQIRKVHTGFYGPATEEYDTFVKEFDAFINNLNAE